MSILDLVQQQLDPARIQSLGQEIGADPAQTQTAIQAALPMLLGGMAETARQPGGATAIAGALDAHTAAAPLAGLGGLGGLGDLLGGVLGGSGSGGGLGSILGSVLGGSQPAVEGGVQQASGLNSGQTQKLLMVLAPIVLAALARHRQQAAASTGANADANGDGIPDVLQREAQQAREQTQHAAPHVGGIVGKILDAAMRH